ncbi:MAG: M20/M25/M40 family metallo-hydrolase [Gemmatimonadota bacterium]|nr:MAG: M20/M25/M40 family metallo-hydrolase [Gemmatimonadota bacterium]
MRHIEYLASDDLEGRRSGTKGAEKAAEYIAREFEWYGLKPVGDDGTYFQNFDFVFDVRLGPGNSLSVSIGGKEETYSVEEDFLPLAFSSNERVTGEVVFAGYGISAEDLDYDDYENIDVTGKIVMAFRYGPEGDDPKSEYDKYAPTRYKAMTAREKGAAGLLLITGPESYEQDEIISLKYDSSVSSSGIVAMSISRDIAAQVFNLAGRDLRHVQSSIDSTKVPQSFHIPEVTVTLRADVVHERRVTSNVVGFLEGGDPELKDELIVIGAHYDHLGLGEHGSRAPDQIGEIHNGADDNASGVAGVLELAEAFSADRSVLRRSLLFIAFGGEEIGIIGSNYYVNNPIFELEKTVTMINLDMIGRLTDNKLIVQGVGTAAEWDSLITFSNETSGFDLALKKSGYAPGDNTPFYAKKIPVLFFFTDAHEDYHTPWDDVEKINVEGEEKIVEYVRSIATYVDTSETRPLLTQIEEEEKPTGHPRFRVSVGTIPDFAAEVEGVKLTGVREGGPAERAGIKGGDIIVRLGEKEIKNLYDYTYALGEYKPGDVVDVVVIRDGQRLTFEVTLEKRK